MGLARGIYMVDTHVHGQRHAFKLKERNVNAEYDELVEGMSSVEVYSNEKRLLFHMDQYNVAVAVLLPAYAMTNELNAQMVKAHPDRFAAMCYDVRTQLRSKSMEEKWNIKNAVREIDEALSTGMFVGIGEGMPRSHDPDYRQVSWPERFDEICQIMELAKQYKVAVTWHAGFPAGYAGGAEMARIHGHCEDDWGNPLLCHEVAAAYPEVPIIMEHAGIEGSGYRTDIYEQCLTVARSHHNIYLECGMWWAELYKEPLMDPNIGCEKLVWGTDWGAASTPQSWMPGHVPETFCNQDINVGLPAHQIDIYGWSLRELGRLNIQQYDLNLIVGGNACRILGIKTPVTRLFKEYIKQ
jgi:predicted TIM-barrel fold metal-dependent hydrolase